jgi:antitoxin (DNA-binding transcriptional repressor) of toxin-antitoxin stability system
VPGNTVPRIKWRDQPFLVGYYYRMKFASSTTIKKNFSAYIDQVKRGETILVLEHGKPVAQISKPTALHAGVLGLKSLERLGLVSLAPQGQFNAKKFIKKRPALGGINILSAAIRKERDGG